MLIILAIFSIFFGYITKDIFIGLGSGFFFADNSLFIHPNNEIMLDQEFAVPLLFKLLPLIFTISFSVLAMVFSLMGKVLIYFKLSRLGYNIFGFFNQRFFIELLYNKYITGLVLMLGGQTTKVIDKGSVELLGPFGLEKLLISFSKSLTKLNTDIITSYALYILIGLISFMFIVYLSLSSFSLILLLIILAFFKRA